MVRKFSTKPGLMKATFRAGSINGYTFVSFWFEVEAKGIKFRGRPRQAQRHCSGKFEAGPREDRSRRFWTDDTVAKLSVVWAQWHRDMDNLETATKNLDIARKNLPASGRSNSLPREAFTDVRRQYDDAGRQFDDTHRQLQLISGEMATPDFLSFFTNVPLPLQVPDAPGHDAPSDERAYALYRGSVWVCSRELEPEQWRILVDDYVAREDAEFAQALGLLPQAQPDNREAIPTAVRRAVWVRDGGHCTHCGSRERLEYDHIIPISRGGSNTERNIELLCEACNRAKSDAIV
jgi:hypothetical protein